MWTDARLASESADAAQFILNRNRVTDVTACCDVMESICESGQELKVTWFTTIRYGVLKHFTKEAQQRTDIVSWEADFEWSATENGTTPQASSTARSVQYASDSITSGLARLQALVLSPPDVIKNAAFIKDLSSKVDAAIGIATSLQTTATAVADMVVSMSSGIQNAISQVGQLVGSIKDIVDMMQSTTYQSILGIENAAKATYGQAVSVASWAYSIGSTGGEIRDNALSFKEEAEARFQTEIIASHVAAKGQDLRSISMIYYKTPDNWRELMLYNGLQSVEVAEGSFVLVPRLTENAR
jgi:hypothetical protein